MAGVKITELTELTGANASDSDVLVIVDVSAGADGITKYIKYGNLLASQIETAEKADQVNVGSSTENSYDNFLLFAPNGSGQYDSVYADAGLTYNPSTNRLKVDGGFEGTADRALVADSANFDLTSLNDVSNTFTGLVAGQILKYDGAKWTNLNDNIATPGSGVIAQQITTKSAGDLNVAFLIPMVRSVGADSVEVDGQLTYNPNSNTLTTTNFDGNATTATFATGSTNATNANNLTADSATTTSLYLIMREDNLAGADSAKFDVALSYNATSETLSATNFSGNGSSLTNVAAVSATSASAVNVSSVSNDATYYVHFGDATTGTDALNVSTNMTYNPTGNGLLTTPMSYTPNNGTHWIDPDPTTVAEAIDRLAAVVYSLNGDVGA